MDDRHHPDPLLLLATLEEGVTGMMLVDGRERVVFWNKWLERAADRSQAQVLNRPLLDIFPELSGSRVHSAVRDSLDRGLPAFLSHKLTPSPFPLRVPGRVSGQWLRMCQTVLIKPVRPEGMARHCLIQILDITNSVVRDRQLREQARQLEAACRRAEDANRAKSQFLANMSHEVRTPLNGILGMSELLAEATGADEIRHLSQVIRQSGDVLLRVIDDILDFSKIEAGELYLERTPFSPRELLAQVCALFEKSAVSKGVAMTCQVGANLPEAVLGDPVRVAQILNNLLSNAVKFTHQGNVNLRADRIRGGGNAVRLRFQVSDTGTGIPTEHLSQLFEAFTQGDGSTTRKYGGTGLGLAITRSLVTLMQGTLQVHSEPGIGTGFQVDLDFSLPVGAVAASSVETGNRQPDQLQVRVLVVEDDEINRDVLSSMLRRLQPPPRMAVNGRHALEILETETFDLILMDCQMPEMDGFAACRALRERERSVGRHTPVVALTAHAMKGDRERCLEAGMDDYLTKPVRKKVLTEAIARWTGLEPST